HKKTRFAAHQRGDAAHRQRPSPVLYAASARAMMKRMKPQEGESAAVDLGEKEAARLVNLLSRLVRLSGRPLRSLEKELHLGSSVVSKIFRGVIRPQLSYVVMIAAEIGIPPE